MRIFLLVAALCLPGVLLPQADKAARNAPGEAVEISYAGEVGIGGVEATSADYDLNYSVSLPALAGTASSDAYTASYGFWNVIADESAPETGAVFWQLYE